MMVAVAVSCTKDENVMRGTSASSETELLLNPLTVQVMADPNESELPADLEVDIAGPDAENVYTVSGQKQLLFEVSESDPRIATLSIGIRRIEPVSTASPVEFTLTLTANGYHTVTRNISLTDAEGEMCNIRLMRKVQEKEGAIFGR